MEEETFIVFGKMRDTFLICAFPRSRTLWLSHFLSVPGVSKCTHEATEHAASAQEFWANAECAGADIYGNSDSANIYVLPSMLAEKPLTRTVWIARPIVEVCASMKAAGLEFTEQAARTLMRMRDEYRVHLDLTIDFHALNSMETCRALWEFVLPGVAFDAGRWGLYADRKIAYGPGNMPPVQATDKFLSWFHDERVLWPIYRKE
jgi:hypothetical protein